MSLESPSHPYQWTFRRVMWATFVLVFVAVSFWLLYRSSQAIFILFIAIVFGTVIRPIVNWLYNLGVSRTAGAIIVYLLLLALLIGFLLLLLPLIADQSEKIVILMPIYYQKLRVWLLSNNDPIVAQFGELLPVYLSIPLLARETSEEVIAAAEQEAGNLPFIAKAIITAIVVPLLSFYWTLYGARTVQSLLLMFPSSQRERMRDLFTAIEAKVGAFIAGQGLLCLVIGALALIAYVLIGLPNALVLALIAGLLEAVPLIGPWLGAVPAAIVALSIDPSKLIWVVVATIVIQQFENTFLVPRVMRKTVGVHPFVTLLALFAFSSLLGIPGAFMAIPIAAILQLLLDRLFFEPNMSGVESAQGRDYSSRLRYDAHNLTQDLRKHVRLKKGGQDMKVKQVDQVLEEIEAITTDLDALLAKANETGEQ